MNVKGSSSIYTLSSIVNAQTGGNDPRREDSEVFSPTERSEVGDSMPILFSGRFALTRR